MADRLNYLFEWSASVRDDGAQPSYRAVATAIEQEQGVILTGPYIRALRAGRKAADPSFSQLNALARYFGVPVEYFLSANMAARVEQDLRNLAELRSLQRGLKDAGVLDMAMRAGELSTRSRETIVAMVGQLRRLEGLDDDTGFEQSTG